MKNKGGVTLVELMIAVALIGIGILGAVGAFNGIQKAIQYSKTRTLATNIAQEKMQIIMQKAYYEILVTTQPATRTDVTPNVTYDPSYFPPETLTEGGVSFTRYTDIQVIQENSGTIQILPPLTPDTGMRQITETVVWATDRGNHALTIQNVINNPNTALASTWFKGTVSDASTGTGIPGALVVAAENIGWRDTADSTGKFSINLVPGTFDFEASAPGYFTQVVTISVPFSGVANQNFSLIVMSSGTVEGSAWIDNHLVISQVVPSTGPSNSIEYVDLYNPTTAAINVGTNAAPASPNIWIVPYDSSGNSFTRQMVYISTFIPADGYYLVTNTGDGGGGSASIFCSTITISGVTVQPDACWRYVGSSELPNNHTLQCNDISSGNGCSFSPQASGVGIETSGGTWLDTMGWLGNGTTPSSYETAPLSTFFGSGMTTGEAFVRRLDTTSITSAVLGNAYDTNNNPVDFIDYVSSVPFAPGNSSVIRVPKTGTPATGAVVSITDGLSASTSTVLIGNPPFAFFSVPGVATGTWVTFIDSHAFTAEIDTVSVTANTVTWIPNATTNPTWAATGSFNTVMATSSVTGMINGKVLNALLAPLSGITVTAGGSNTTSGATGSYFLRISTGIYDVTANPGNVNATYASVTVPGQILSNVGDVTANVNFSLSQVGEVTGWVTRDGTNPLPGVAMVALDANGAQHDTEVSANNGRFTLINLATGPYTIQPSLDSKEISTPIYSTTTVTVGTTLNIGTFTITGAMGQVQGTVTANSALINSGVLIVISTQSIVSPPALSSASLTSAAYYADSSNETGSYSVDVRGSTTSVYNVKAFYMHVVNGIPTTSTGTVTSVTVTAGQATTGVNFSW